MKKSESVQFNNQTYNTRIARKFETTDVKLHMITDEYLNLGSSSTRGDMCQEVPRALSPKSDEFVLELRSYLNEKGRD